MDPVNVSAEFYVRGLPVPGIIGGTLDTPTVPFLGIFYRAFARMEPVNVSAEFDVRGFTLSLSLIHI